MENNIKKKVSIPIIIGLVGGFILIVMIVVAIMLFVVSGSETKKLNKQLDLGEKYLNELDYDNAILAYKKVLEIDINHSDAYKGIVNAYLEKGDNEEARNWAKKGYKATEDPWFLEKSLEINVDTETMDDTENDQEDVTSEKEEQVDIPDKEEKTEEKPFTSSEAVSALIMALPSYYITIFGFDPDTEYIDQNLTWSLIYKESEEGRIYYIRWDVYRDLTGSALVFKDGRVIFIYTDNQNTLNSEYEKYAYLFDFDITQMLYPPEDDPTFEEVKEIQSLKQSYDGFSDEELCEKVTKCFRDLRGTEPPEISVLSSDEESVIIEVHEDTTTLEWFFIDRKTGIASMYSGGDVDLSKY